MTNPPTLNAFTGGEANLSLYAPTTPCPWQISARKQLRNYDALNMAFQQATGWELVFRETPESRQNRIRTGQTKTPATGFLSISDLSTVLPPGIPAVSRVYCEHLVGEFNKILSELGKARLQLCQQPNSTEKKTPELAVVDPVSRLTVLQSNLAFQSSNFALTPLHVDEQHATCEWFVDESGIARFAAIVCQNHEPNSTRELIAARSTFLAECRHGASNRVIHAAVTQTVSRLFPGESSTDVLTGTLNPLTGDITMVGSRSFCMSSTNLVCSQTPTSSDIVTCHLQRGHHLVFSRWASCVKADEVEPWNDRTIGELRGLSADRLADVYKRRLDTAIPRLPASPQVAFSVSRPR